MVFQDSLGRVKVVQPLRRDSKARHREAIILPKQRAASVHRTLVPIPADINRNVRGYDGDGNRVRRNHIHYITPSVSVGVAGSNEVVPGFIVQLGSPVVFYIVTKYLHHVVIPVSPGVGRTAYRYLIDVGVNPVVLGGGLCRGEEILFRFTPRPVHAVVHLIPPAVFEIDIGAALFGFLSRQRMGDLYADTAGAARPHSDLKLRHTGACMLHHAAVYRILHRGLGHNSVIHNSNFELSIPPAADFGGVGENLGVTVDPPPGIISRLDIHAARIGQHISIVLVPNPIFILGILDTLTI